MFKFLTRVRACVAVFVDVTLLWTFSNLLLMSVIPILVVCFSRSTRRSTPDETPVQTE